MKNNIILLRDISVAFLLAVISLVFLFNDSGEDNGDYAVIRKNGEIIQKISLSENIENFTVDNIENMKFTVKDGRICVSDSDCPDKICINKGFISKSNEIIICLPNKVSVEIETLDKNSDADIILN